MQKILRIRKSIWAAICIWLAFARTQQMPAQVEILLPKISTTHSLNIFGISLTRDSMLRILGRTASGTSFAYGSALHSVDQPKGAFVDRLLTTSLLNAAPNASTSCPGPTAPTPPPLPPVSTLPTTKPIPPASCTQIRETAPCVTFYPGTGIAYVRCVDRICCLRAGAGTQCATVSSWSYTTATSTTFGGVY